MKTVLRLLQALLIIVLIGSGWRHDASAQPDENTGASRDARIDLREAVIVYPAGLSPREQKAVSMLIEEVEKRVGIKWPTRDTMPAEGRPAIVIGPAATLAAAPWSQTAVLASAQQNAPPEGYRIRVENNVIHAIGNDERGVLFAVGHLLRHLSMAFRAVSFPAVMDVNTAPRYALRGHQLGYRDKTNSYCGWDLRQWEQYYRDLIVFGANAIELLPPGTDDNDDSVHFPLPPLEMMTRMSRLADEYGLDVWVWYPLMGDGYDRPERVQARLAEWQRVFAALPRLDALFVPGGDPGRTHPGQLMPFVEQAAARMRAIHPRAQVWIAPQGFEKTWMDVFVGQLAAGPAWLNGVVHGPQILMTTAEFRRLIPARYPIRNYPDITHTAACQFPVENWDPAFAQTQGREPICPRPVEQAAIFAHTQPATIGALTYSEGCHDDVNKAVWSALGWDPQRPVEEILRDYSRYFIGPAYEQPYTQGLLALERNWKGPIEINEGIEPTQRLFRHLERTAPPGTLKNWRFQQALYRAYYDAYLRVRRLSELGLETQAMSALRQAPTTGTLAAMRRAEALLDEATIAPVHPELRTRVFQLAEALFQSVHMQLSVPLYRAQQEWRGANLDGIDVPLNNSRWLKANFAAIRKLDDEQARLVEITKLVAWKDPGPGGFYDEFTTASSPRVVRKADYAADPGLLTTPGLFHLGLRNDGPIRRSWNGGIGVVGHNPLEMAYGGLDRDASYRVRIVYSEDHPKGRVRLVADDGLEVHPYMERPGRTERKVQEFDIPRNATADGHLTLRWNLDPDGREVYGSVVCEVWLIRKGS